MMSLAQKRKWGSLGTEIIRKYQTFFTGGGPIRCWRESCWMASTRLEVDAFPRKPAGSGFYIQKPTLKLIARPIGNRAVVRKSQPFELIAVSTSLHILAAIGRGRNRSTASTYGQCRSPRRSCRWAIACYRASFWLVKSTRYGLVTNAHYSIHLKVIWSNFWIQVKESAIGISCIGWANLVVLRWFIAAVLSPSSSAESYQQW